jgi:hypothetical protein
MPHTSCRFQTFILALTLLLAAFCLLLAMVSAQSVTVDITSGHQTNTFSPIRALGAGVDAQNNGAARLIYQPANVQQMLSAGWGPVSYRLYTELGVQDWHWNPKGTWSDSSAQQGYWTGSTTSTAEIVNSYGYRLPHRGNTNDQANNDDYSRLDDGDTTTYWKSNPYLSSYFTGESDSLHPQWTLIDLGAKKSVDAIRIAWTEPHAVDYLVQYWTGPDAINDPAQGMWVTFPDGTITNGAGGTVTLQLSSGTVNVRFVRIWMTSSSNNCGSDGSDDVRA